MRKYILHNVSSGNEYNAGDKAGGDAVQIARNNKYAFIQLYKSIGNNTTISNIIEGVLNTIRLYFQLKADDIVFLQYPVNRFLMKIIYNILKKKHVHTITLVHDIDYLRSIPLKNRGIDGMKKLELSILSQSKYLICHNKSMIQTLKNEGLTNKMVSLEIFDYLYTGNEAITSKNDTVIIAGNLAEQKAGYLYKLREQGYKLSLYGANLGANFQNSNFVYHGVFSPDLLISNLDGSYGLVWDGNECDTCAGAYGNYLRFNNPHKVSLYLAAGLPVIIWKESALYPFIVENNIGFGVNSLREIEEELKKHNWQQFRENVIEIQKKIRTGAYLTKVLSEIEEEILNG